MEHALHPADDIQVGTEEVDLRKQLLDLYLIVADGIHLHRAFFNLHQEHCAVIGNFTLICAEVHDTVDVRPHMHIWQLLTSLLEPVVITRRDADSLGGHDVKLSLDVLDGLCIIVAERLLFNINRAVL